MNQLVQRLAEGNHPVIVGGPHPSLEDFKKRVEEIGYTFIKFTDTQGGTDLGVRIDHSATDLTHADFHHASGEVHVEGTLVLNYVKVRCVADIELATLQGKGHLVFLDE